MTGSGRTALAARLSTLLGVPWHSVDELTWEPGWVGVAADEQRRPFEAICAGDRWVPDTARRGGSASTSSGSTLI